MAFLTPDMSPALAEIVLGSGICVVLLADLFISDRWRDLTFVIAMSVLVATAWAAGGIGLNGVEVVFERLPEGSGSLQG